MDLTKIIQNQLRSRVYPMAIAHISLGNLSFIVGIAQVAIVPQDIFLIAPGVWGGIIYFITGMIGLKCCNAEPDQSGRLNRSLLKAFTIFNIIVLFQALAHTIYQGYLLIHLMTSKAKFPYFWTLEIMTVSLMLLAFGELITACMSLAITNSIHKLVSSHEARLKGGLNVQGPPIGLRY